MPINNIPRLADAFNRFSRLFGSRMGLEIRLAQPVQCDVRVDLRGGYAGMTQQLLNQAQIRSVVQQVCRKGVTQHVRMNTSGNARFTGTLIQQILDPTCREWLPFMVDENPVMCLTVL